MAQKVKIQVTVNLTVNAPDDFDVNEVLGEMDYKFTPSDDHADATIEAEIQDWEVTG